MNHKFFIVLSVAVFYNGVIYASPLNNSEGSLPEEKPPTALPVANDNNKKIEPVHVPTTPITQKSSVPLNQTEIPTTALPDANGKNVKVPLRVPIFKSTITHDLFNKNETAVINHENSTLVTDGKNTSQPIDNKSVTPVNGTTKTTVPAGLPSSVSPSTLAPTAPPTAVPEKSTTTNLTTSTTPTTNLTTSTTPTTISKSTSTTAKVEITTIKPNSSTTQKAAVVHDVVAPVQEKHFDGPSFIGGIVLTIGLTAIGFIAFKYYKAGKIDMNYRSL